MEYGSRVRFTLFAVIGIVFVILSAWGIISISRRVFGSNNTTKSSVAKINLDDYIKSDTLFSLDLQGPIVANEQYVSATIEVTQDYRQITVYKGYEKTVVSQKRYQNNNAAYEAFVKALKKFNYSGKVTGVDIDEVGNCATGQRFVYTLSNVDENVIHTWSTSCSTKAGNFAGAATSVRSLYKAQIPDYKTMTTGLAIQ